MSVVGSSLNIKQSSLLQVVCLYHDDPPEGKIDKTEPCLTVHKMICCWEGPNRVNSSCGCLQNTMISLRLRTWDEMLEGINVDSNSQTKVRIQLNRINRIKAIWSIVTLQFFISSIGNNPFWPDWTFCLALTKVLVYYGSVVRVCD